MGNLFTKIKYFYFFYFFFFQVNDRFKLNWGAYLTTSEQVIYAVIDGRGSGFQARRQLICYTKIVLKKLLKEGNVRHGIIIIPYVQLRTGKVVLYGSLPNKKLKNVRKNIFLKKNISHILLSPTRATRCSWRSTRSSAAPRCLTSLR